MSEKEIAQKLGRNKTATLIIRGQEIKATNIRFLPTALGFYVNGQGEYRENFYDIQDIKNA